MFAAADSTALSYAPGSSRRGRTLPQTAIKDSALAVFDKAELSVPHDCTSHAPAFDASVLPVLHINELAVAVPLAECLQQAGLNSIVVAAADALACAAIRHIRAALPTLQLGADLAQPGLAADARAAGADYLISAALPRSAFVFAERQLLRVRSVRELRHQLELGQSQLVLAPSQLRAGLAMLKILAAEAPLQRVGVMGAIERHDLPIYLAQANVAAVAAPWVVAPELIRRRDWSRIAQQARVAAAMHESTQ